MTEFSRLQIVMRRPWPWKAFAVWATLFPLILLNAIVRKAATGEFWDLLEALSLLLLMAILVAGGLWLCRIAWRKIVVRDKEIEVIGRGAARIYWREVKAIQPHFVDKIEITSNDGRRIVVERPLREWADFLRALPDLVEPEARAMAERAVRQVAMPHDKL